MRWHTCSSEVHKRFVGLMFGWCRGRLHREQMKLVHQNDAAAQGTLYGYFHNNALVLTRLKVLNEENYRIRSRLALEGRISNDDLGTLLDINRELRAMYGQTASRYVASFDKAHVPLGGWEFYFSEFTG